MQWCGANLRLFWYSKVTALTHINVLGQMNWYTTTHKDLGASHFSLMSMCWVFSLFSELWYWEIILIMLLCWEFSILQPQNADMAFEDSLLAMWDEHRVPNRVGVHRNRQNLLVLEILEKLAEVRQCLNVSLLQEFWFFQLTKVSRFSLSYPSADSASNKGSCKWYGTSNSGHNWAIEINWMSQCKIDRNLQQHHNHDCSGTASQVAPQGRHK